MRTFVFASTLLAVCANALSQNTAPPPQRSQPTLEKQDKPARKSSKPKAP
jgi:hypothetical protein